MTVGQRLLDLLLPPQCLCCDSRVQARGLLCAACFGRIEFVTAPYCTRCGVPFVSPGQGDALGICPACRETSPIFRQARAALCYAGRSRQLILPLKHADRIDLATAVAAWMARVGTGLLHEADALVPVPLHRARLFHRRYNQAALLATAIGRIAKVPTMLDGLIRQRPTESLGHQSAAERADTVRDAFAVRPSRAAMLIGRRVVLVDDVMTSGATANACSAVLLQGGAKYVDVLVAARVPDPRLR